MNKTIIHAIEVRMAEAKIQFQIKLPRDVKKVVAIGLATDATYIGGGIVEDVGSVWLRVPGIQDCFFADTVRVPLQSYGMTSYSPMRNLSFGSFSAWVDGTKTHPLSIEIDREATMIEGYYSDELRRAFADTYTVKIYLTIEV
jgi:hypothetical protein